MNHETAVAMAVVLAVIVITIIYSMISGGIDLGEQGVGNITERAEDDSRGQNLDFIISDENDEVYPKTESKRIEVQL